MTSQPCFLDCPHEVGECLAALRSYKTAMAVRHRGLDLVMQRAKVRELQAQARLEKAAVRSIVRFLRWPMKQPPLIH